MNKPESKNTGNEPKSSRRQFSLKALFGVTAVTAAATAAGINWHEPEVKRINAMREGIRRDLISKSNVKFKQAQRLAAFSDNATCLQSSPQDQDAILDELTNIANTYHSHELPVSTNVWKIWRSVEKHKEGKKLDLDVVKKSTEHYWDRILNGTTNVRSNLRELHLLLTEGRKSDQAGTITVDLEDEGVQATREEIRDLLSKELAHLEKLRERLPSEEEKKTCEDAMRECEEVASLFNTPPL